MYRFAKSIARSAARSDLCVYCQFHAFLLYESHLWTLPTWAQQNWSCRQSQTSTGIQKHREFARVQVHIYAL